MAFYGKEDYSRSYLSSVGSYQQANPYQADEDAEDVELCLHSNFLGEAPENSPVAADSPLQLVEGGVKGKGKGSQVSCLQWWGNTIFCAHHVWGACFGKENNF